MKKSGIFWLAMAVQASALYSRTYSSKQTRKFMVHSRGMPAFRDDKTRTLKEQEIV
jgi:hypothetical protein